MKRIWCFLLTGLLVVCLAACGSNPSTTSDTSNSPAVENNAPDVTDDAQLNESDLSTSNSSDPSSVEDSTNAEGASSNTDVDISTQDKTSDEESEEEAIMEQNTFAEGASSNTDVDISTQDETSDEESEEEAIMEQNTFYLSVGGETFSATFADNSGAQALKELLAGGDITIQMSDYGGFEKVGPLGQSLPTENSQTTTQAGDIVLYQGNQIVIFYGSNSWSYTRLGKIDDLTGWQEALGSSAVSVTLSLSE